MFCLTEQAAKFGTKSLRTWDELDSRFQIRQYPHESQRFFFSRKWLRSFEGLQTCKLSRIQNSKYTAKISQLPGRNISIIFIYLNFFFFFSKRNEAQAFNLLEYKTKLAKINKTKFKKTKTKNKMHPSFFLQLTMIIHVKKFYLFKNICDHKDHKFPQNFSRVSNVC